MRIHFYWILAVAVSSAACSGAKSVSPLSNQEVNDQTEIYLGSDRYYVAVSKKPAQRRTAVDTEFILTKSKDISVGVSSDAPTGRGFGGQNDGESFVPASMNG